jgi:hypothetical protein
MKYVYFVLLSDLLVILVLKIFNNLIIFGLILKVYGFLFYYPAQKYKCRNI